MRVRMIVFLIALFMIIGPSLADESLSTSRTTTILDELASRSQTTWLPAGTIVARREEYRAAEVTDEDVIAKEIERQLAEYKRNPFPEVAPEWQKLRIEAIPFNARYWMSNAYTMTSTFVMHYDGSRYYCERQIESREDSVQVPAELKGNPLTEDFRMEWNGHRILAWDGQDYTTYNVTMDHVMAEPAVGTPGLVEGPFTAGILPWGEGMLAEKNLAEADVSAVSVNRDGDAQVEMAIVTENGSMVQVTLDPSKNNAVTWVSLPASGGTRVENRYYSGYQKFDDNWVPTTVLTETRDAFTDELISYDRWDFVLIDGDVPAPEAFVLDYTTDTRVEFESPLASATYNYSNLIDTDELLARRLEFVAEKTRQKPRNCATAALKYAASRMGKLVSDAALDRLVDASGQTSLFDLKRAVEDLGLHCRTVATNVEGLKELEDCVAILYLPAKQHFVVLDRVDERYVWLIDLASTKMYYRADISLFPASWPQGIALLVSDRSISGAFSDLSDAMARSLLGAASGWSCTYVMQERALIGCVQLPESCIGYQRLYYGIKDCEAATPDETCESQYYLRQRIWTCKWNSLLSQCIGPDWSYDFYSWACDWF